MSADSVHLVEEAFSFAVQPAFDAQCREFIRHHTNAPTGCVRPAAVPAINQNLRRSLGLITRTEGAILRVLGDNALAQEIVRPLSSFGRNDHPASRDRVFTQLRQSNPPRKCSGSPAQGEQPGDFELYLVWRQREDLPPAPSNLRTEGIFVKPHHRRLPGAIINRHYIKPAWTLADMTFG